jgi:hypothetical protein
MNLLVIAKILHTLAMSSPAPADAMMVLRASADHYALVGVGTVETIGCTVSAEGADHLTAKVRHGYLRFYDANGEVEGECTIGHHPYVAPVTPEVIVRPIGIIRN